MMTTTSLTVSNERAAEEDMFSDLQPVAAFTIKKIDLATQLNALMVFSGKSRSDIALSLGWKKSQVTRVLSGKNNFTVKTIWDFSSHLGFDFDIVFRASHQQRPRQPWQIQRTENANLPVVSLRTHNFQIEIQSASEVAVDFLTGNNKSHYFSFNTKMDEATHQALPATIHKSLIPAGCELPVTNNLRR